MWFRSFKGKSDPEAFSIQTIKDGISYVHNLFAHKNCKLIFLADRWFPNCETLQYIDDLGDTYCIRAKTNIKVKILDENVSRSSCVSNLSDIIPLSTRSKLFRNVTITEKQFNTKLAVSKISSHKEPFYILTNENPAYAIKHYRYRFGSIEFIFKNHKSNGFYLESTKVRNIQAFITLFGIACIALLWLTILGSDYTKNQKGIKSIFKFRNSKKNGEKTKRIFSLFNTGLNFFNLAFESRQHVLLKFNFLLYDL